MPISGEPVRLVLRLSRPQGTGSAAPAPPPPAPSPFLEETGPAGGQVEAGAGEGAGAATERQSALTLVAGAEVEGTVEVEVLEDVSFRELEVRLGWRTEGKGNRTGGVGASVRLEGEGEWRKGTRRSYPFRLEAPWGPLSYRGKILSVVWELEARLDRYLLRGDVRTRLPVELVGAREPRGVDLGPRPQKKEELEARKRGLSEVWLTLSGLFFVGVLVLGASRGWSLQEGERWLFGFLVVGGLVLLVRGSWGRLGRGKLGEPAIHLDTTDLRRGEEIRFHVALRPYKRTELRLLEVILECEERVVHGHGQYQTRHRRTVFEHRQALAANLVLSPERGLRRKGVVTIPPDAPPSFGAPYNQVVWWLRFRGDIVGWPDWNEPFLLTVRP